MSPTQTPIPVESLAIVTLPVSDQDAALEWYRDVLGFDVAADDDYEIAGETGRWLTVRAPTGGPEISLVSPEGAMAPEMRALVESRIGTDQLWTFTTRDIDAALDILAEHDVDTDEVREMPWGRFAMFRDPDGNDLQLYEAAGAE